MRPHGISSNTFIVYLQDLRFGLRLPFGSLLSLASLPTFYASYPVSVRQATISLLLLLSFISPYKTCKSLSDSLTTTLFKEFHLSFRTCSSYQRNRRQIFLNISGVKYSFWESPYLTSNSLCGLLTTLHQHYLRKSQDF